jgi:hypothetical protein
VAQQFGECISFFSKNLNDDPDEKNLITFANKLNPNKKAKEAKQ